MIERHNIDHFCTLSSCSAKKNPSVLPSLAALSWHDLWSKVRCAPELSGIHLPIEGGDEARVCKILATDGAIVKGWKVSAIGKLLCDEMEHVRW